MENKKGFIALEVNEVLYFERGQEVSEMRSISLDPDISLEVNEQEVNIRGIIVLNGAYHKQTTVIPQENNYPQPKMFQYIEKIVDKDEGVADFYHRFPVDITIPNERVQHIEDINIKINDFDYELPDHHTLKVNATLHITGLREEVKQSESVQIEKEQTKQQAYDPVSSEQEHYGADKEEAVDEEKTNTLDHIESEQDNQEPSIEADASNEIEKKSEEEQEIDISLKKTEEIDEADEVSNVQFLTDLFGNKEEEMQTTVTIYIAQEEDTVETIAKRFEMPTLQLVKDNELSGEKLESGQLLYITRD